MKDDLERFFLIRKKLNNKKACLTCKFLTVGRDPQGENEDLYSICNFSGNYIGLLETYLFQGESSIRSRGNPYICASGWQRFE